jgi:hypothetical protein
VRLLFFGCGRRTDSLAEQITVSFVCVVASFCGLCCIIVKSGHGHVVLIWAWPICIDFCPIFSSKLGTLFLIMDKAKFFFTKKGIVASEF